MKQFSDQPEQFSPEQPTLQAVVPDTQRNHGKQTLQKGMATYTRLTSTPAMADRSPETRETLDGTSVMAGNSVPVNVTQQGPAPEPGFLTCGGTLAPA